eukprot:CAMPEP_0119028188 /NCGR_PEP_ID=MMETSP1176-20130426/38469_1 /TAXON_ID=265551 /ORGANISM="Synedropsis recta cf, Strain CCMP1620" /LENGTH=104 /DNA_ID=CAMNT_0006984273 /DNA_START=210 /DNA_END=521 /DNA_ORIENTATION=+
MIAATGGTPSSSSCADGEKNKNPQQKQEQGINNKSLNGNNQGRNPPHDDTTMYWCAIGYDSFRKDTNWNDMLWGWSGTIQHSAEVVLPCWSWFQQQRQQGASSS